MQFRRIRIVLAVTALAVVTAACGGDKEIGGDLEADGSQGGGNAIGQATTTTAAPVTTAAPTATTAKPTATTVAAPSAIFKIQDDTKGQYVDPLHHTVRAGSLVRFVNEDDSAHTIELRMGSTALHKSPAIAPGGSWDVRPGAKGTYDVIDTDRTYAAGITLTVS